MNKEQSDSTDKRIFFDKEVQEFLNTLKAEKEKSLVNTGVNSYKELGFLIQSILSICQKSLFVEEINKVNDTKVDIYNLLDMAKELLPHSELELLDVYLQKY